MSKREKEHEDTPFANFYVEWGRQTIWKDFNCVGFFFFFSFNFEKEIMFMSLNPTILY